MVEFHFFIFSDFLFGQQLLVHALVTRTIHVSKNHLSTDSDDCGNLTKPCFSLAYALQMAGNGDTVTLDRNFEFPARDSIDAFNDDLELTSYCVASDSMCSGKKRAVINLDFVKEEIFSVENLTHFNMSKLHIKTRYSRPKIFFRMESCAVNVKMSDCIVNVTSYPMQLTNNKCFHSINIENVVFSYKYNYHLHRDDHSTGFSTAENHRSQISESQPFFSKGSRNKVTKPQSRGHIAQVKISKSSFENIALSNFDTGNDSDEYYLEMDRNTLFNSNFDISCKSRCYINITNHTHIESSLSINGNGLAKAFVVNIVNTSWTGQSYSKVVQSLFELQAMNNNASKVVMDYCLFQKSNEKAVTILNAPNVHISNTQFRGIKVTDLTKVSLDFAAGLTLKNLSCAYLENVTFHDIFTLQNIPSSMYITANESLVMKNVLIETSTLQDSENYLVWGLRSRRVRRFNTTVKCLYGNQKIEKTERMGNEFLSCTRCDTTSYNVQTPTITWGLPKKVNELNSKCLRPCPYQASCIDKLKSRGYYWGLLNKQSGSVDFYQCPPSYCCSSQQDCLSYDTCINNRSGRLCGDCKANHSIALLGPNRCVLNEDCKSDVFWVVYWTMVLLALIFVLYLKDILSFIGKLVSSIIKKKEETQNQPSFFEPLIRNKDDQEQEERKKPNKSSTMSQQVSGLIKTAFFFYQVADIIRVGASAKTNYKTPIIMEFLTSLFNIRMSSSVASHSSVDYAIALWCPFQTTNVFLMEFLRVSIILWCPLIMLFYLFVKMLFQFIAAKVSPTCFLIVCLNGDKNRSLVRRFKCGIVQFLIFGFASISMVCLESVHCIEINSKWFLYKQAESVECYQGWQRLVFVVIVAWVVSFPFALYIGVVLLRLKSVTPNEFLFMVIFPPSMIGFFARSCLMSKPEVQPLDVEQVQSLCDDHVIASERLALLSLVNEPFRTNPGHDEMFPQKLVWEPVLLMRRFLLLVASIFIENPVFRIYPIGVLLVLFGFHDYMVKPFSDHKLNVIQTVSHGLLFVLTLINSFWAFSNDLDLTTKGGAFHKCGQLLLYFELFILLTPLIVLTGWVFRKAFIKVYKVCLYKQD